jgi:hypothetical protein
MHVNMPVEVADDQFLTNKKTKQTNTSEKRKSIKIEINRKCKNFRNIIVRK